MEAALHALLALRNEHQGQPAGLLSELVTGGDPLMVASAPPWAPSPRSWLLASRQLVALARMQIRVLPVWELPLRLLRARPPPLALFVRGDVRLLGRRAVGIVGARAASRTACAWAKERAARLAAEGHLVVSGGARGIDRAAHEGALAMEAPTLAYLGVAADAIYPTTNRHLFERILEGGGALVSEHPPLTRTFGASHAMRNRLIAGHADQVIVAEAQVDSGSLGTAAFAHSFGVPVWVAPPEAGGERGGLDDLLSAGRAAIYPGDARFTAEALRLVAG